MLNETDHARYQLLLTAAAKDETVLMDAQDLDTGELVSLVCSVRRKNGRVYLTPLARMLSTTDATIRYAPPRPDEGYESTNAA